MKLMKVMGKKTSVKEHSYYVILQKNNILITSVSKNVKPKVANALEHLFQHI